MFALKVAARQDELNSLLPAPLEITVTIVGVLTLAYCVFCLARVIRGRLPLGRAVAMIVLALILPVAGVVLGYWLMRRTEGRELAPQP